MVGIIHPLYPVHFHLLKNWCFQLPYLVASFSSVSWIPLCHDFINIMVQPNTLSNSWWRLGNLEKDSLSKIQWKKFLLKPRLHFCPRGYLRPSLENLISWTLLNHAKAYHWSLVFTSFTFWFFKSFLIIEKLLNETRWTQEALWGEDDHRTPVNQSWYTMINSPTEFPHAGWMGSYWILYYYIHCLGIMPIMSLLESKSHDKLLDLCSKCFKFIFSFVCQISHHMITMSSTISSCQHEKKQGQEFGTSSHTN